MIRKPAIPQTPKPGEPRQGFDVAVKETLETITGRRSNKIEPLATTATLAQTIAKINELIELLQ